MEVGLDELSSASPSTELDGWEAEARRREQGEVARYEGMLAGGGADARTEALLREILDTERHHAAELGGKWTAA
jgi:hypothetical protein